VFLSTPVAECASFSSRFCGICYKLLHGIEKSKGVWIAGKEKGEKGRGNEGKKKIREG